MEQQYLKKIAELSHADQVIELLGDGWLDGFKYIPDTFDKYHGTYEFVEDNNNITVQVNYGAAYGYHIVINQNMIEIFACDYLDYTGVVEDDAAKIYDDIMRVIF